MPIRQVPGDADLSYFLLSYSADGVERSHDPDAHNGLLSDRVLEEFTNRALTDVFLISHGWQGDLPAAIDQYDRWIGAMSSCFHDRAQVRQKRPDFEALLIGLHWPSLPWGDERLDQTPAAFSVCDREEVP